MPRPSHRPKQRPQPNPRHERRSRGDARSDPAAPKGERSWMWGLHAVKAALANPQRTITRILATEGAQAALRPLLGAKAPAIETVSAQQLDAILGAGTVHQGVAAQLMAQREMDLEEVLQGTQSPRRIIVLDQVSDPHNVGAILRSAAAFGVTAVIVQDRHSPPMTGAVAKAASGAAELVPVIRAVNIARALEELEDHGFLRVGLADEANAQLTAIDRARDLALVLGAEGAGLRRLTREKCDMLVRLPTLEAMPSLNVSNAAAVALYAMLKPP